MRGRLDGFGVKVAVISAAGLALAGSAYAGSRVDGADLVPGSITGKQLAANTIGLKKLKPAVRRAVAEQGATGPQGIEGPRGPAGPAGNAGATGPAGVDGNAGATGPQGPTGATGPSGPIGPIGQQATTVVGSAQLQVSSATTTFTVIPGLTSTVTVPADADVYVSTDGGLQNTGTAATDFTAVDVALFVDGVASPSAGQRRITAANNGGINQNIANWSFGRAFSLSPGSHTFSVRAVHVAGSTANVSSGSAPALQGALTVSILKH